VSEVEDWILVDLVHYAMEMERNLQLLMERLFAKQSEEMKARQEEADAKIEARLERMEAAMHSMRSDIERSVQKLVEDVLSVVDHKTHSLQLDLTETFESTQVKLHTIELALGVETNSFRLDLSTVQAGTISNRQATFERIEAVRRDFYTRLEEANEMAGHVRGNATEVQRDYIMVSFPAPIRDSS
jgi:hypothetical protein